MILLIKPRWRNASVWAIELCIEQQLLSKLLSYGIKEPQTKQIIKFCVPISILSKITLGSQFLPIDSKDTSVKADRLMWQGVLWLQRETFLWTSNICGPDSKQPFSTCVKHRLMSPSGLESPCSDSGPHRLPNTSLRPVTFAMWSGAWHTIEKGLQENLCSLLRSMWLSRLIWNTVHSDLVLLPEKQAP